MLEKIDEVLTRSEGLSSEKEKSFLLSIRQQYIQRGALSGGQQDWFSSLEEKFSKESLLAHRVWENNWSPAHREIAINMAHYYEHNKPYYSDTVTAVFADPENFILSKKQWDRFCENKYAKRIRTEYAAPAKFAQGDCIQIRRTNKVAQANYTSGHFNSRAEDGTDKVGFVLKLNAKPITRAAKGSKIYQILLAGATTPIFAHESDLKKTRKLK